eukprot:2729676-Lingulodinium_polyedra.AAC.1
MLRSGAGHASVDANDRLQVRTGKVQGMRSDMAEAVRARSQVPTTTRAAREGARGCKAIHAALATLAQE